MNTPHEHIYELDVPHFYSRVDDDLMTHYDEVLADSDDDCFVHLKCSEPKCYDEQHTMMSHEELNHALATGKIIQSKLKLL